VANLNDPATAQGVGPSNTTGVGSPQSMGPAATLAAGGAELLLGVEVAGLAQPNRSRENNTPDAPSDLRPWVMHPPLHCSGPLVKEKCPVSPASPTNGGCQMV